MFEEQASWAADAGVDFIIAETLDFSGEALLALEATQAVELPAVVTLVIHRNGTLRDGFTPEECCRGSKPPGLMWSDSTARVGRELWGRNGQPGC